MLKERFPLFKKHPELVYLDSAATKLKPASVIAAQTEYLEASSTNIARGLYPLAEGTTARVDAVRKAAADFIGSDPEEIIFTSGTTAGLNMAAYMLENFITLEGNVVATDLEHHSNYLPWKELAKRSSAEFRLAASTSTGALDEESFEGVLDEHTELVALTAVSNVSGIINDIPSLVRFIRKRAPHAIIIIDAAQRAAHLPIDVREWDADMIAFSGHKMYGPTGIGILYGKKSLLDTLPPAVFGGGMVSDAYAEETVYREVPARFEAGTPDIAAIFGLGEAFRFLEEIGFEKIREHDLALQAHALSELRKVFGEDIQIIGSGKPEDYAGILSFTFGSLHPHDIAQLLGEKNVAVRAGEHCAAPFHRVKRLAATTRISFGIYNEKSDIDRLVAALKEVTRILS
ncbi:MAG: hypothetical protein A2808_02715 [Candidatus Moranbacteria bacterium RIFCSPHIGHO2_01_FULL_55_24]|nr:MAG: hypothetical protein A2808_02715 [Candidatus Moranbacteria bacterium RIFCSPHIGHO2_01_FULL_55_24]